VAGEFRDSFRQAMSELFLGGSSKEDAQEESLSVEQSAEVQATADVAPAAAAPEAEAEVPVASAATPADFGTPAEIEPVTFASFDEPALGDAADTLDASNEPAFSEITIPDITDFAQRGAEISSQSEATAETTVSEQRSYDIGRDEIPVFSVDSYASDSTVAPVAYSEPLSSASSSEPSVGKDGWPVEYNRSTVIAEGTEVKGEMKVASNAEIYGVMYGNVSCSRNIFTKGVIVGDVIASNLDVAESEVRGDVATSGAIRVGIGSSLIGDVSASRVDLRGMIKGNSAVLHEINVHNTAIVDGNVDAGSMAVGHGAKIEGFVTVGKEED